MLKKKVGRHANIQGYSTMRRHVEALTLPSFKRSAACVIAVIGLASFGLGASAIADTTAEAENPSSISLSHISVEAVAEGEPTMLEVGVPAERTYKITNTGEDAYIRLDSAIVLGDMAHANVIAVTEGGHASVGGEDGSDLEVTDGESSDRAFFTERAYGIETSDAEGEEEGSELVGGNTENNEGDGDESGTDEGDGNGDGKDDTEDGNESGNEGGNEDGVEGTDEGENAGGDEGNNEGDEGNAGDGDESGTDEGEGNENVRPGDDPVASGQWVLCSDGTFYRTEVLGAGESITVHVMIEIPFEQAWIDAIANDGGSRVVETIDIDAVQARAVEPDFTSDKPWGDVTIESSDANVVERPTAGDVTDDADDEEDGGVNGTIDEGDEGSTGNGNGDDTSGENADGDDEQSEGM